jgi:hypothetical protein
MAMASPPDNIEIPLPVMAAPPTVKRYRQVGLRDTETGRRRTVNLRAQDYATQEEMEVHAKKLMAEQREKNRLYRDSLKRANVVATLERTPEPVLLPTVPVAADGLPDVTIRDALKLKLDKNTGSTVLILGSSKRGKSHLMMRIYEEKFKGKDDICTLFTDNPHLRVYKGDDKLLCTYGFGERHAKYVQMQHFINVKTKNEYSFVNFIDDVVDRKNSPIISKMLLTYRNANISTIICLQYLYLFSKQNRANVNHTFCFGVNSAEDAYNIVKNVLKPYFVEMGLKSLDAMIRFYRAVTVEHGFIYINNVLGSISFHRLSA